MKNAREQQWHTYMCTFAVGWGRLFARLFACTAYAHLCVCLSHVLECKRVVAHVVCLCLNQPVNTHVGFLSFFFATGVCDHLCRAQSPGSWLMPCRC